MLIYVTEIQRIAAINNVTGNWDEGKERYSPSGSFPICLSVETSFRAEYGLTIREIQRIVPTFRPHQGLSLFPISKKDYLLLEQLLISNG